MRELNTRSVPSLPSLAAFCFFVFSSFAHADALEQLRNFAAQVKSARGEFTQQVTREGRKPQQSRGQFLFARPGKFRWTYTQPYEQVLVADGVKLFIYDKDLNQVTTRKLNQALDSSPAAILFGSQALENVYTLKDAGQRDGLDWVEAQPKSKDSTFEKILIGLKDDQPAAMELRDNFGQTTALTFTRFERNPALPAEPFRFVPPKGADVLEQ
ncbi:MAG: outer membrane lipoprotein chaperone LolA [Burkholderiaceae bacterium]|nr:MAG: outer membrane lipoprotein chaperone LolA [Burkholderiaceae bacterium]